MKGFKDKTHYVVVVQNNSNLKKKKTWHLHTSTYNERKSGIESKKLKKRHRAMFIIFDTEMKNDKTLNIIH